MTRVVSPDQWTGIKTDPALRSITIIAVTSYALNGKEQIARAAGCDDCVPKSFSPSRTLGENPSASVRDHLLFAAVHSGTKRTFHD
jgi:CheY-like chemotaxis protein